VKKGYEYEVYLVVLEFLVQVEKIKVWACQRLKKQGAGERVVGGIVETPYIWLEYGMELPVPQGWRLIFYLLRRS
jgi:hypothetical protein